MLSTQNNVLLLRVGHGISRPRRLRRETISYSRVKSNGHLKTYRNADGGGMEMVVEFVVEEMALSGQLISFEI